MKNIEDEMIAYHLELNRLQQRLTPIWIVGAIALACFDEWFWATIAILAGITLYAWGRAGERYWRTIQKTDDD